jgi:hypothetical protein
VFAGHEGGWTGEAMLVAIIGTTDPASTGARKHIVGDSILLGAASTLVAICGLAALLLGEGAGPATWRERFGLLPMFCTPALGFANLFFVFRDAKNGLRGQALLGFVLSGVAVLIACGPLLLAD